MEKREENDNLISIDEVIYQVQNLGVNFGNGDPRNRLRYYVKIGLLPNAKRKAFNGGPPNGAYSEYVVDLLVEIDKKIKSGKSIQAILREKEKEGEEKEKKKEEKEEVLFNQKTAPPYTYSEPVSQPSSVLPPTSFKAKQKFSFNFPAIKIGFLILIIGAFAFWINGQADNREIFSYFLASLDSIKKQLVVGEPLSVPPALEKEQVFVTPAVEPYLTINAETVINGLLNVKEKITTPNLLLIKGAHTGNLTTALLSSDHTYTFPDSSGIICLSTGNCVGLSGEVLTTGGIPNRTAKFISSQRIGSSSINDLYNDGVSITVDTEGKIGIGIKDPFYPLHVEGRIQATGDICTDLRGGKCLSELAKTSIFFGGGGGIGGVGSANYIPIWTGSSALGDSVLYQSGGNIGINTTSPSQKLDVAGTVKMTGFQLPTDAAEGYVLTSDASGAGTWQVTTGTLPVGQVGQTLRYDGVGWVANSFLYNNGSSTIGIGTTSTLATLTVAGGGYFEGPLTIATTTLPQLVLSSDNNYLNFSLQQDYAEISASSTLIINSLTGEIRLGSDVSLFNASGTEIRGDTFISSAGDSTVRKSGEIVLRSSIPVFRFSMPAQTNSTSFIRVSKQFTATNTLDSLLPSTLPGATRTYAFLINFADDIPGTASSSWRVYRPNAATTSQSFEFSGQAQASLTEGTSNLSSLYQLPDQDWQLEVRLPSNEIRIFNIFLLVYDQIQ